MMTYLKRRLSSNDLTDENEDANGQPAGNSGNNVTGNANMQNSFMNFLGLSASGSQAQHVSVNTNTGTGAGLHNSMASGGSQLQQQQQQQGFPKRATYTSAPASPTKTNPSGLSFNNISSQISNTIKSSLFSATTSNAKCKVLLVIDDASTDWSKYFRGKKLQNEFEIRVEQATFSELRVSAFSEQGAVAEIVQTRDGQTVSRSFKPDYVLIRQHVHDGPDNWKDLVIALLYGGVQGVNNLHAVYNFQDKPWVFAQLIAIQQRLGHDQFPLIEQAFYPCYKDMERSRGRGMRIADASIKEMMAPRFPVVVKVAHAHGGMGKMKVETQADLQDVAGLIGLARAYATTEQFVDAKYDIRVQKIGANYKAFIRKSISGNWKANIGANVLEKVPMNDRFKSWIDECSQIFGGLDVCAVELVHGKDGQPYIIDVAGSSMPLLGETQEEDRRLIADLIYAKMQQLPNKPATKSSLNSQMQSVQGSERTTSANGSIQHSAAGTGSGVASQQTAQAASNTSGLLMQVQQKLGSSPAPAANSSMSGSTTGASATTYSSQSSMQSTPQRGGSVPPTAAGAAVSSSMPSPAIGSGSNPATSTAYGAARTSVGIGSTASASQSGASAALQTAGRPGAASGASIDQSRVYSPNAAGATTQASSQISAATSRYGPTGVAATQSATTTSRMPYAVSQSAATSNVGVVPSSASSSVGVAMQQRTAASGGISQPGPAASQVPQNKGDEEDTMKNLRKTFAGIFGDN